MHTQDDAIEKINSGNNVFISGKGGCVDKDTEFLTTEGWKVISDYKRGDLVGQISERGLEMSFCEPLRYIKEPCSEFNVIKSDRGVEQWLCDNHSVAYTVKDKNKLNKKSLKDIKEIHVKNVTGFTGLVPHTFNYQGLYDYGLSEEYLRLGVALKADGSLVSKSTGRYVVRLKRKDKIKRFRSILSDMNYEYKVKYEVSTGYDIFTLYAKWCSKTLGQWMLCTKREAEIILDEMQYWDASARGNREPSFYTAKKEEADVIQYCATISGYKANIRTYDRRGKTYSGKYIRKSVEYVVSVSKQTHTNFLYKDTRSKCKDQELVKEKSIDGFKYCFTVPTGFLVLRRKGKIFVTGNCGKSYIIKQVTDKHTVLSAPTGIAALNIGGETCHSLFGLPFGIPTQKEKDDIKPYLRSLFKSGNVKRIIIDEVSMLRADHLDLIDYKLKKIMGTTEAFGGIQTILVGDLWQLPCIITPEEKKFYRRLYKSGFIFDSNAWQEANFKDIILDKPYRQEDLYQVSLLDAIRSKKDGWEDAVEEINKLCTFQATEDILSLCLLNADADKINLQHFKKNKSPVVKYTAKITGKFNKKDCIVEPELKLKVGLRAIVCANDPSPEKEYKNGQMGEVVELNKNSVVLKLDSGEVVTVVPHRWETTKYKNGVKGLSKSIAGTCEQIPIRQGNAISTNKAQSLTLDELSLNLGNARPREATTYVALSRVRDLTKVHLARKLTVNDIVINRDVKNYYDRLGD